LAWLEEYVRDDTRDPEATRDQLLFACRHRETLREAIRRSPREIRDELEAILRRIDHSISELLANSAAL
jgi:hypothetical protein